MPADHSGSDPSVIERLMAEPWRFQFFQAVRLLLQWLAEHGIGQDEALNAFLRFDNGLSLSFPASQIEALAVQAGVPVDSEAALLRALLERQLRHIRITPAFIGLLGGQGALPIHYSARLAAYEDAHQDEGPRALLDLFSNRLVGLFYAAWDKYRVEPSAGRDRFLPLLLALAGGAGEGEAGAERIADEVIAHYGGLLNRGPVSAVVLRQVLSDYFGVPFEVEELAGGMTALEPSERTVLGVQNCTLGDSFVLGDRVWRPDLRVRLCIGPLDAAQFERFLPRTAGAVALRQMLAIFGNPVLVYEIKLILRKEDVRPMTLTSAPGKGPRLGWDCVLLTGPATRDHWMHYELRLLEPLPGLARPADVPR